jgi:signal transduction histidine kinase
MRASSPLQKKLAAWLKLQVAGERLLQLAVYIILFAVMVVFIIDHPAYITGWRFYGTVLCLALVLVLNILWTSREGHLPYLQRLGMLVLLAALILGAVGMGELYNAIYLFFMLSAQAAIILDIWPAGILFSLANMAAWLVVFRALGGSYADTLSFGTSLGLGILFILLMAILLDRYSRQTQRVENLLAELRAANANLEAARQKEKELAVAEERVRLARDIHDGLGHHLTVLSIQLQAADKLVGRNPQAAAEAIQTSRAETQAALEEVRRSVSMMRQSPDESRPLAEALAGMLADFEQHAGLRTSFEQSGPPVELPAFAYQTLYRTVQEGLTNAQKHGQDVTQAWVQLEYQADAVRLLVRDDGRAAQTNLAEPPGFGLLGLRERVGQLGGSLRSGAGAAGGFEIEVCIPLQEAAGD